MAKRRKRRKKHDGLVVLFVLLVSLWLIKTIYDFVKENLLLVGFAAITIIVCVFFLRTIKKQVEQKKILSLKQNYGFNKDIQQMILYINEILKFQKHKLNNKEKEVKNNYLNKYYDLYQKNGSGYVYFVKEHGNGSIKIGKANDPYHRILKGFGVKFPYQLEIIHLIKTENDYLTESLFHQMYKSKRTNGEWFELTDEDVKYILSRNYSLDIYNSIIGKK